MPTQTSLYLSNVLLVLLGLFFRGRISRAAHTAQPVHRVRCSFVSFSRDGLREEKSPRRGRDVGHALPRADRVPYCVPSALVELLPSASAPRHCRRAERLEFSGPRTTGCYRATEERVLRHFDETTSLRWSPPPAVPLAADAKPLPSAMPAYLPRELAFVRRRPSLCSCSRLV